MQLGPSSVRGSSAVSRGMSLTVWLAIKSLLRFRPESQIRLAVGAATIGLALAFSALSSTALNVAERDATATPQGAPVGARDAGVRFEVIRDYYEGEPVSGVRVAPIGEEGARYEGIAMPSAGQMLVSPAARSLLSGESDFAARYPGKVVGEVPKDYLLGPRAVVVWEGAAAGDLSPESGWLVENPNRNADLRSQVPQAVQLGYVVVVLGFILPLLALSAILASLGSRMRSERASALQLLGVRPTQLRSSVVVEDVMLSAASIAIGSAAFFWIGPLVCPVLPFGEGIWSEDLEVDAALATPLIVVIVLLGAVTAWRSVRPVEEWRRSPRPRRRRRRTLARTGWYLILSAGLMALASSQLQATPPHVASILLLASMPATAVGFAGILPNIVMRIAGPLSKGSASMMWAARSLQSSPERAARTSTGVIMLLTVAGLMMLFFPLISDLNATTERRLMTRVGSDAIVATGPDSPRSERRWSEIRAKASSGAALRWFQPPGRASAVFFADCGELANTTGIPVEKCRRGLLSDASDVDIGARDKVAVEARGATVTIPATVTYDSRVADLTEHFSNAGAIVLPETDEAQRSRGVAVVYFVRASPGQLEPLRTQMTAELVPSALTVNEQYEISTYTTRQFTRLLWFAIALTMMIASMSTIVASFDMVRSTRAPRRLLAIAGARGTLASRALQLQVMIPLLIAVPAATVLSLTTSAAFVRLYEAEGGNAQVPTLTLVFLAALSLSMPAASGALILKTESRARLLQNPE